MSQDLNPNPTGIIGKACLTNSGAFVCKLYLKYWDTSKSEWVNAGTSDTDLTVGQTDCEFPGTLGCPPNSRVRVCCNIVLGPDCMGDEQFVYVVGNTNNANYTVQNTTSNAKFQFTGITGGHTDNSNDKTAAQAAGVGS